MNAEQIECLIKETESLYKMRKYEEALKKASEVIELTFKYLGEEHSFYATSLNNLAGMYKSVGRYGKALPLFLKFMEVRSKVFGENHPGFAVALNNLAGLYKAMGRYTEALPLYQKCMEIEIIALGEEHANLAVTQNNLAGLYKLMGQYGEALPLFLKSKEILKKTFGEEHPDFATVLNNLAGLYEVMGRYDEVLPLFIRCREIRGKVLGEDHPHYATILDNLAGFYEAMGLYDKALPLYIESEEIRSRVYAKELGEEHPDYATSLSSLAGLYDEMGWYEEALPLYTKCKEVRGKVLGEDHPDYAIAINNLAGLYERTGGYEEALPLYIQCKEIRSRVLGEGHPDYAETLNGLAGLYESMGLYEEALPLYLDCKEIRLKAFGEEHPSYASTLHNLAYLYESMGRYEEALSLYQKSREIGIKVLGENHPSYAATLTNLAHSMAATGDYEQALNTLYNSIEINNNTLARFTFTFTEQQLLSFHQSTRYPIEMLITLVQANFNGNSKAVQMALDVVLKNKAIIYEAIATHYQSALSGNYPDLQESFKKLQHFRTELAQNWFYEQQFTDTQESYEEYMAEIKKLQADHDKLESQIASQIPQVELQKRMQAAEKEMVINAMPPNSHLLEFFAYHPYNFTATGQESHWEPARYIVFVFSREDHEKLEMIDLGEAEVIDLEIVRFLESIKKEKIAEEEVLGRENSSQEIEKYHEKMCATQNACRKLYNLLLLPAIPKIRIKENGKKHIDPHLIIAPDGEISRIPFEALVSPDGKLVIEEYQISYVTTSREVVNFTEQSGGNTDSIIVADPDYDLHQISNQLKEVEGDRAYIKTTPGQMRHNMAVLRSSRKFMQLHFGRKEGSIIKQKLVKKGMEVKVFLHSEAVERTIKAAMKRPKILHIVSHGFYFNDPQRPVREQLGVLKEDREELRINNSLKNPLLRSGIVLAGINTVISGGQAPEEAEDGVLFALDVLTTDLMGTELVVLSACETGLGDIRLGEGVTGLRKAFVLAGAKTILIALWNVDDEKTLLLMNSFYSYLLKGENKATSLRRAQLELIRSLRMINEQQYVNPLYWAGFICVGDLKPLQGLQH